MSAFTILKSLRERISVVVARRSLVIGLVHAQNQILDPNGLLPELCTAAATSVPILIKDPSLWP